MKLNERYLVVVSGPSGSGKDSTVAELLRVREDVSLAVSYTTRERREYEEQGKHYNFVSRREFEQLISDGMMLEYTEYAGNYYGTPLTGLEEKLTRRETVVLVIEVNGARRIKELFPGSLLIFIVPPSVEELERRLRLRGTESHLERFRRLEIAQAELRALADYDYVIQNDRIPDSAARLADLIDRWQEEQR